MGLMLGSLCNHCLRFFAGLVAAHGVGTWAFCMSDAVAFAEIVIGRVHWARCENPRWGFLLGSLWKLSRYFVGALLGIVCSFLYGS